MYTNAFTNGVNHFHLNNGSAYIQKMFLSDTMSTSADGIVVLFDNVGGWSNLSEGPWDSTMTSDGALTNVWGASTGGYQYMGGIGIPKDANSTKQYLGFIVKFTGGLELQGAGLFSGFTEVTP